MVQTKIETHYVQITFEDYDFTVTKFNGTPEEIQQYYVGNYLNMGVLEDKYKLCIQAKILK